jgi:hypothetical protein
MNEPVFRYDIEGYQLTIYYANNEQVREWNRQLWDDASKQGSAGTKQRLMGDPEWRTRAGWYWRLDYFNDEEPDPTLLLYEGLPVPRRDEVDDGGVFATMEEARWDGWDTLRGYILDYDKRKELDEFFKICSK